jgi:hypothetical protein
MNLSRFLLGLLILAPISVHGSPIAGIPISGTTLGCFGSGCTPVLSDTLGGLTFIGGVFSGTTDSGGEFAPGVSGNSFGLFVLSGSPFNYGSFSLPSSFTLLVDLASPSPGSNPDPMFNAEVAGVVNSGTQGTVSISFAGLCHGCGGPPAFLYNYAELGGTGTLSVHINPHSFSLSAGSPATQTLIQDGHFHTTFDLVATPEPGTYSMGLAGISLLAAGILRKRKRA